MQSETQITNEQGHTQITSNPEQPNKTKFYLLVVIQQLVILISTYVPAMNWFFDSGFDYPRKDITFHQWCFFNQGCQNENTREYRIERQNFAEWKLENYGTRVTPIYSFYISQVILLIIIIAITNFRDKKIVRDYQKPFYIIQLLFLSILIQYLCGYANFYFENKQITYWFQFTVTFLIINLIFLVINEKLSNNQIHHSTMKTFLTNFYSFTIFFTGIGYQLDLFNSNYAIQLLVFIVLQIQLLQLQQHLFNKNNKYIKFNKSLMQLFKEKITDFLFLKNLKEKMPDYLIIHRRLLLISLGGVVISFLFRHYVLTIPFFLIVMLTLGILFLDTSILSTKFHLTLNDSYLAASLFVLDCCFSFRNLAIEALVIES